MLNCPLLSTRCKWLFQQPLPLSQKFAEIVKQRGLNAFFGIMHGKYGDGVMTQGLLVQDLAYLVCQEDGREGFLQEGHSGG